MQTRDARDKTTFWLLYDQPYLLPQLPQLSVTFYLLWKFLLLWLFKWDIYHVGKFSLCCSSISFSSYLTIFNLCPELWFPCGRCTSWPLLCLRIHLFSARLHKSRNACVAVFIVCVLHSCVLLLHLWCLASFWNLTVQFLTCLDHSFICAVEVKQIIN